MNEPLSDYSKRFNEEALIVKNYVEQSLIHVMLMKLRLGGFKWDMTQNNPKILTTMIKNAQKHALAESIMFS